MDNKLNKKPKLASGGRLRHLTPIGAKWRQEVVPPLENGQPGGHTRRCRPESSVVPLYHCFGLGHDPEIISVFSVNFHTKT